jgi:lipopolysaccharide transport system ATP-binding protein
MTADVVIRAEGLGKKYLIGHRTQRERDVALRDLIAQTVFSLGHTVMNLARGQPIIQGGQIEEFWALKDMSFEVRRGDTVGIIGRNGAGKSTLLKVLSRITELTEGQVEIKGRVASLLEVGTGFHRELTGYENIFLNGAILGMTRSEIKRKLDEIVDFAGMEKFLDTPVKRYSSGMYMRLAFAVAAHLEPEILVVDEVLAVGDAEFQRKCLGKMKDVAGQGRTVLFVSHNMAAVSALCTRGFLITKGGIEFDGPVDRVVERYSNASELEYSVSFPIDPKRPSIFKVNVDREALIERTLFLDIAFASPWPLKTPVGGLVLRTAMGEPVWGSNRRFHPSADECSNLSHGVLRCEARHLPLTPGDYLLSVWLSDWHEDYDSKIDALRIKIGDDCIHPHQPPASFQGYLDWPAVWCTALGGNGNCELNQESSSRVAMIQPDGVTKTFGRMVV